MIVVHNGTKEHLYIEDKYGFAFITLEIVPDLTHVLLNASSVVDETHISANVLSFFEIDLVILIHFMVRNYC
jgi:hypothetical protein